MAPLTSPTSSLCHNKAGGPRLPGYHFPPVREFTTPSLEQADRRRWELFGVLAFVLAASAVAAAVVPGTWVRVSLGLVALLFVAYTAQEEVRLGRLRRTLVDERVLRAALSNRIRELSSLSEVSKALNSVLDLDDVLGLILDSCLTLLEATDGSVKLLSDDEESLVTVSSRGEGATPLGAKQPAQSGVSGWLARRREPLLVS